MSDTGAGLDATFGALADPTRRAILARLCEGEATVSDLAAPFDMSLPAVLKHLGALEGAGLVEARKDGRVRRCQLRAAPLREAVEWIARYRRFWEERFDAIEQYLRATGGEEDERWPQARPGSASSWSAGSPPPASGSSAPSRRRRRSRSGSRGR